MKGDFSRITYDDRKHYSLVFMQQGRVQLDADWNEQAIIQWQNLQKLVSDLIGEHGGPNDDFMIEQRTKDDGKIIPNDFNIKRGHYYVEGVLCENYDKLSFTEQEDYPIPEGEGIIKKGVYLVYLHVWWRHITSVEDDSIREVALGGPDTATRIKTIWQVKVKKVENVTISDPKVNYSEFKYLLGDSIKERSGMLIARAKKHSKSDCPCIISPDNRYRGVENQLYRVEIHRSGQAYNPDKNKNISKNDCATFKWSRENGAVVFPIIGETNGNILTLEHLGRDARFGLKEGDWVEVVDDILVLQGQTGKLLKIELIDPDEGKITLSGTPQFDRNLLDLPLKNPLLRRWDHDGDKDDGGAIVVKERENEDDWIDLEDGVQIQFPESQTNDPHWYRSGDWWWIPARTATGDVEWPRKNDGDPKEQKPIDPGHRYAPLALIDFNEDPPKIENLRRKFKQLWE